MKSRFNFKLILCLTNTLAQVYGYALNNFDASLVSAPKELGLRLLATNKQLSNDNGPDNELILNFTTNLTVRTLKYTGYKFTGCNSSNPIYQTFSFSSASDITLQGGSSYQTTMGGNWTLVSTNGNNPDFWHYNGPTEDIGSILIEFDNSAGSLITSHCINAYLSATQSPSNTVCNSSACQFYTSVGSWQVN